MRSVRHCLSSARRAALGIVAAAVLIGGCGSGPRQAGAAAIVGDTVIPLSQVQSQLATVLAREGSQTRAELAAAHRLDDVSRQIVTLKIWQQLLAIAAKRAGIPVDQARVDRLVSEVGGAEAAAKGTIFDPAAYRQRFSDKLLMDQLGRVAVSSSAVTVDYTTASTRTAAKARLEELAQAGPKRARQLIDADVRAGKDAVIGKRVVAADDPIFAASPAFGVAQGTVVAFQLEDTKPWLIVVIKDRTDRGVQPSDHAPTLDRIPLAALEAIGLRQAGQIGEDVGVRLNPRYGVWDPLSLQVVANDNETSGFLAPLRAGPEA